MNFGLKLALGVRVGGASATANFSSTSGYAPLGLIVEVEGLNTFDYQYVWDFDDTGTWSALSSDNMFGNAKGTAYGPCACHTFESPGTYTVTCTVKSADGTEVGSFSQDITVTDPDAAFPGTQTICIDPDGIYAGAPSGSNNYTSVANAWVSANNWLNKRILLRAGFSYDIDEFPGLKNIYLGKFGSGDDPIISFPYNSTTKELIYDGRGNLPNLVATNIHFKGDYDANLSGGNGGLNATDRNGLRISKTDGYTKTVTVHSCTFSNLAVGFRAVNEISAETTIVLSNNTIREWADFGVYYDQAGDIGFVGNSIKQEIDAVNGGDGKQFTTVPQYPDHGPIRLAGPSLANALCTIHHNEFFNNCGWSVLGTKTAHQPCIRYNTAGAAGTKGVIERNIMEGGNAILSATATSGGALAAVADYLIIEKNYIIGTAGSSQAINLGHGNTDFRNNVCVRPQVNKEVQSNNTFIAFRQTDSTAYAGAMRIRNNTLIDLRDEAGTEFTAVETDPGYATFVEDNNIEYYPNVATSPSSAVEPFASSSVVYTPRYDGERWETTTVDTTYATPADTAKTYRHGTTSPAENAATANYPPDDFEGTLRGTGNTSDGAYHTGGSVWTPDSLSNQIAWWDTTDNTTVTTAGGTVTAVADKFSGGSEDAVVGGSPTHTSGGPIAIGEDDNFRFTNTSTDVTNFYFVLSSTDTTGIIVSVNTASDYAGVIQDGSSSAPHANAGTPTYRVDGVALSSPTRDDLHTNIHDGSKHIVGVLNVDLDESLVNYQLFDYSGGASFNWTGDVYEIITTSGVMSAGDISDLESYLATKHGITI